MQLFHLQSLYESMGTLSPAKLNQFSEFITLAFRPFFCSMLFVELLFRPYKKKLESILVNQNGPVATKRLS